MNAKNIITNLGASFLLCMIYYAIIVFFFKSVHFGFMVALFLIVYASSTILENYQAKKNFKSKKEQEKYINKNGFVDTSIRMFGFLFATVYIILTNMT